MVGIDKFWESSITASPLVLADLDVYSAGSIFEGCHMCIPKLWFVDVMFFGMLKHQVFL